MNIKTLDDLNFIIKNVNYKQDWEFRCGEMGDGFFIQVRFHAEDSTFPEDENETFSKEVTVQSGRKWYVSKYATKSEVIQTAFHACLKAEEHECREWFRYKNEAVFCPHYSIDELYEFSKNSLRDSRAKK
jgi:hypothetical protein